VTSRFITVLIERSEVRTSATTTLEFTGYVPSYLPFELLILMPEAQFAGQE
jgi:hypothetical protein